MKKNKLIEIRNYLINKSVYENNDLLYTNKYLTGRMSEHIFCKSLKNDELKQTLNEIKQYITKSRGFYVAPIKEWWDRVDNDMIEIIDSILGDKNGR